MATRSFGVKLLRKNGASFEEIEDVVEITPPSSSRDVVDVTSHSSEGSSREVIPSFLNPGTVTATINYTPSDAVHAAIRADFQAGTLTEYKVTLPGSSPAYSFGFSGYVTEFGVQSMPIDGVMQLAFTITISGQITLSNS